MTFQYAALNALLSQKTSYAYQVFRDVMVKDPPVLYRDDNDGNTFSSARGNRNKNSYTDFSYGNGRRNSYDGYRNQNFMDALFDTLQITATIFKDLLPLMDIRDYEQPMMELAKKMVDSNMISINDYRAYVSRFLIQAKQALKKQLIMEKNLSIEKAKLNDTAESNSYSDTDDDGNVELSSYATLLMPFAEENL